MPVYEYKCEICGNKQSVVLGMKDDIPDVLSCIRCPETAHRVWGFTTPKDSYSKPLISDALAMNPNQIEEHRRKFPNIKVYPDGRPEFTSFKQHDDYLKATGFRKKSQKNRVRWTKVNKKPVQSA